MILDNDKNKQINKTVYAVINHQLQLALKNTTKTTAIPFSSGATTLVFKSLLKGTLTCTLKLNL